MVADQPPGNAASPAHGAGDSGTVTERNPADVLGQLRLIECDAEPRHPHLWWEDEDGEGYFPPPCYMCWATEKRKTIDRLEHATHKRWWRWRVVRWFDAQLYVSGLARHGGSIRWGGECNHCVTSRPRVTLRGSRPYILWWETWKWSCLLRQHHWPGDYIALGACAKCLPCPDCGSKTAGHEPGCGALS